MNIIESKTILTKYLNDPLFPELTGTIKAAAGEIADGDCFICRGSGTYDEGDEIIQYNHEVICECITRKVEC